jgi:hypothetical protein
LIPGKLNLTGDSAIYQGDTYLRIAEITLPDLSGLGGPADLSSPTTVKAEVRNEEQELLGSFDIEILDELERKVRPTMSSETTANLPLTSEVSKAYWDLQVSEGSWVATVLRGPVSVVRQETI